MNHIVDNFHCLYFNTHDFFLKKTVTNPLDIIKVRLQMLYSSRPALSSITRNPMAIISDQFEFSHVKSAVRSIYQESRWKGLIIPGLTATIVREAFYSSIRFGLYTPIKELILISKSSNSQFSYSLSLTNDFGLSNISLHDSEKSKPTLTFFDKLFAGMISGALGSALANPTDLVKIRLQHEHGKICPQSGVYLTGPRTGSPPSYRSTFHAFATIYKNEGLSYNGLFRGVYATMTRASLLTGGQLASYEHAKDTLKGQFGWSEGPYLHTVSSIWSGLVASIFCAPADIVKTRLMCDQQSGSLTNQFKYKSAFDCFIKLLKNEGILSLYKGWLPSYLRLAPHFIIVRI